MSKEWEQVGFFAADSGLMWVGDPGYIVNPEYHDSDHKIKSSSPHQIPKSWHEFLDKLDKHGIVREEIKQHAKEQGKDLGISEEELDEFVENRTAGSWDYSLYPFAKGHEGCGICIHTGGDGMFPVFIKRDEYGQIKEVKITFPEEE